MSNVKRTREVLGAVAVAALAAVSCKGFVDGGASPAGDNGSVTATDPGAGATAPAQIPTAAPAPEVVPVPAGTGPQTLPATPQIETPVTLPSPAVLEATNATQGRLAGLTTNLPGTSVRFVDCSDSSNCSSRVEADSLAGLRDLLSAVQKDQGGIGFVAREEMGVYTGHKFVADVTLGATTTRPVPTDENELLVNNDAP
jgi:hypothetical protein